MMQIWRGGGLGCIENRAQHTSCSQDNCHSKDSSTCIAFNLTTKTTRPKCNIATSQIQLNGLLGLTLSEMCSFHTFVRGWVVEQRLNLPHFYANWEEVLTFLLFLDLPQSLKSPPLLCACWFIIICVLEKKHLLFVPPRPLLQLFAILMSSI